MQKPPSAGTAESAAVIAKGWMLPRFQETFPGCGTKEARNKVKVGQRNDVH